MTSEIVKHRPLPAKQETAPVAAPSPEALIAKAIEQNMPVETLERLLAMRDKLKAEQAREAFHRALSAFQAECPIIKKTKSVLNKDGKTVRYKFAPVEEIERQTKALRGRHGFSHHFVSEYHMSEKAVVVTCVITHVGGHSELNSFLVPIDPDSYMNNQQRAASARTFGARYALLNGYGIVTADTDDDAGALGDPGKEQTTPEEDRLSEEQINTLHAMLIDAAVANPGRQLERLAGTMGFASFADIPASRFEDAKRHATDYLSARAKKKEAKP